MKKDRISSIEDLATLTQQEFLAVGRRFDRLEGKVDDGFKAVADVLDIMRADIHDIKITLGPLVRTVTALEEKVQSLDKRVGRLEEKVGSAK